MAFGKILPDTVNPVSVPTDVMFVCAAVCNVPVNVAPELPIVAALIVVLVIVPPTVTELLTVNAFTVALPVADSVDTIAVLPPADPKVPFNGPFIVPDAVTVAPVNAAPELPIVAALIVVPVSVPLNVRPVNVPTDVMFVCAAVCNTPVILGEFNEAI